MILYFIGATIFAIYMGSKTFHKIEEGQMGFLLKGGKYTKRFDEPGFYIYPPFITKVLKLNYTDYDWTEELRDIAEKLDLTQKEIKKIKEEIRDKKI